LLTGTFEKPISLAHLKLPPVHRQKIRITIVCERNFVAERRLSTMDRQTIAGDLGLERKSEEPPQEYLRIGQVL